MEAGDWVLADVQAVVGQALALEGAVLSAGETVLARRVLALTGAPGRLWARLVGRRPRVFRPSRLAYPDVPDLPVALAELRALDLVHVAVPEAAQLACYTVPELKEACGRLGLRRGGRRDQLEARLTEAGGWAAEPVIRVAGHGLLRRLEGLCFQDRWQDRSVLLLERLGVSRWADYPLTSRARAFRRRADFLRWAAPLPEATPEARLGRLRTLAARPRWQRRLCPRRREERHLVDALRELERRGEPGRAAALYRALLEAGATHPGAVAARLAQALDAQGEPGRALAAARRWRPLADPVERLALDRVGRRLSRKTRGARAAAAQAPRAHPAAPGVS